MQVLQAWLFMLQRFVFIQYLGCLPLKISSVVLKMKKLSIFFFFFFFNNFLILIFSRYPSKHKKCKVLLNKNI